MSIRHTTVLAAVLSLGLAACSREAAAPAEAELPTLDITTTGQEETVDGVRIIFQMAPDSEAPVEMNFHFPDHGVLCVAENATLTVTDQLGPYGTVLPARTRTFAGRMIRRLDIKTPGAGTPVAALSGGNQQKVVIARALATDPHVLVAIRPTNGVDVRSKDFLLGTIRQVADAGKAAVIVSDELDDLRVCDRVVVMFHGRAVAEFDRGWSDRDVVAAMEGVAQSSPSSRTAPTELHGR